MAVSKLRYVLICTPEAVEWNNPQKARSRIILMSFAANVIVPLRIVEHKYIQYFAWPLGLDIHINTICNVISD